MLISAKVYPAVFLFFSRKAALGAEKIIPGIINNPIKKPPVNRGNIPYPIELHLPSIASHIADIIPPNRLIKTSGAWIALNICNSAFISQPPFSFCKAIDKHFCFLRDVKSTKIIK